MLKYDSLRMYIIGMENEKDILKNLTPNEKMIGLVVPFVLFWCGMLTPIFSDSVLVWILGVFPFYGFIVFNIVFGKNHADLFLTSSVISVFTSVISTVLLFFIPEWIETLKNVCIVGLINVAPSLLFLFICATNSFVESVKGCPIPVVPFIIDSGS